MSATAIVQLRGNDPRVPYKKLNAAARAAGEHYPEASKVRPIYAPASERGPILLEVTQYGRTRVVMPK